MDWRAASARRAAWVSASRASTSAETAPKASDMVRAALAGAGIDASEVGLGNALTTVTSAAPKPPTAEDAHDGAQAAYVPKEQHESVEDDSDHAE